MPLILQVSLGLQHQIRTAQAPCCVDWAATIFSASPECRQPLLDCLCILYHRRCLIIPLCNLNTSNWFCSLENPGKYNPHLETLFEQADPDWAGLERTPGPHPLQRWMLTQGSQYQLTLKAATRQVWSRTEVPT